MLGATWLRSASSVGGYQGNSLGKTDACHFAFWELMATLDHIMPISGGAARPERGRVTHRSRELLSAVRIDLA